MQYTDYSAEEFSKEAKTFGYSDQKVASCMQNVGWSIWHIPRKNSHFVGRASTLALLAEKFRSDPKKSSEQIALVGVGGMGKSSLAVEYMHQFQHRYSLVWWMGAEQSPATGLRELGEKLGIKAPEKEFIRSVIAYLEKNPGWLLVYDNAESPQELFPFLPKSGGHILITSRNATWRDAIRLEILSPSE